MGYEFTNRANPTVFCVGLVLVLYTHYPYISVPTGLYGSGTGTVQGIEFSICAIYPSPRSPKTRSTYSGIGFPFLNRGASAFPIQS